METIRKQIHVNASVEKAYGLWSSFERLPEFMENIEEVTRVGANKLHWKANIGGSAEEWDVEYSLQPNQRVAWHSISGSNTNAGEVTFQPEGNGTLVTAAMEIQPDSKIKEMASKLTGITESDVEEDLNNFKRIVEQR